MARPLAKTGLNSTTERELVWWLAKGHGIEDAARRAGLPSSAKLYRYKRTNAFADDLRQALKDHLATELAPKAIRHPRRDHVRHEDARPRPRRRGQDAASPTSILSGPIFEVRAPARRTQAFEIARVSWRARCRSEKIVRTET